MRSDVQMGDKIQSTIFDVDAQKMYMFDSKKKEADVWDMAAFGAEMSKSVDVSGMKASIKPNGQTKQIRRAQRRRLRHGNLGAGGDGRQQGHDDDDHHDRARSGSSRTRQVAADYNRFYKAAVEKGWIFGDPRAAKAQPGQAKAMAEMYKQFAEIGGIAYEIDMQIKMGGGGGGPLGGLLRELGNMSDDDACPRRARRAPLAGRSVRAAGRV